MVEIGGRPILWHVLKIYLAQGFRRFLLLTGYRGEQIERFVADESWPAEAEIRCLDTGLQTPTGGRLHRAATELGAEEFCLTYADGVADIDLGALLDFHAAHSAPATMTVVRPELPFGVAELNGDGVVRGFIEKPRSQHWINGGFFCFGLLGGWLVRALLEGGARVVVVRRDEPVRSTLGLLGLDDQVDTVPGDIASAELIGRALNEYDVDSVFHLAAQTLVGTANRDPLSTFETNIRGTWLVLEACRRHGVASVIVASSDKAYGRQTELPYREDQPLVPIFPYDVSKAAADLLARSYWHTYDLPVAVTRFANLYGGGDINRSRLVPEAIGAALAGRAPVIRSDGSPERDFLYVEDAVSAYLGLWQALLEGRGSGEAFNAGGGQPHRVGDVVELICRLAGNGLRTEIRGEGVPRGEIDRQWVDAGKLRALTGWGPAVDLEEGLRRSIAWYREHPRALL
jgi:CDP-glucose 4,6-dehydratase